MKPILEVSQVSKAYATGWREKRTILHSISFNVMPGEVVSLIGINGAGKTTLLKLLTGISSPTQGEIKVNDRPISQASSRQDIGYMPENPQFYPSLNGLSYLIFTAGLFSIPKKEAHDLALKKLDEVDLTKAAKTPIRAYSKGMRQRLGFAQATLASPRLLLLDEPLDGLDPLGRQSLKNQIIKYKHEGVTVFLCSHILSDIAEVSDRVGILHSGRLKLLTTPKEVIGNSSSLEEAFVNHIKR